MYLNNLVEEDLGGDQRELYPFNGKTIATRASGGYYQFTSDHLGSVSIVSDLASGLVSKQDYTPWGDQCGPDTTTGQTSLNYTGQRKDAMGLVYYHSRYYDPALGRFLSPDTVVPGNASGGMDGVELRPLTVDVHEPGFVAQLTQENQQPFWFQMSQHDQQKAGSPFGPMNPQGLNRYSYVRNNPVRYSDPTGHEDADPEDQELQGGGLPGGSGTGGGGGGGGNTGNVSRSRGALQWLNNKYVASLANAMAAAEVVESEVDTLVQQYSYNLQSEQGIEHLEHLFQVYLRNERLLLVQASHYETIGEVPLSVLNNLIEVKTYIEALRILISMASQ